MICKTDHTSPYLLSFSNPSASFIEEVGVVKRMYAEMDRKIVIIKHVEREGAGLLEDFFKNDGWELEFVELEKGDRLPEHLDGVAGIILLGGPMNVYQEDGHPFLKDEDRLITRSLVEEIPILGICLGAQLLAKACDARVEKATQKEIGWYPAELTDKGKKDLLFRGIQERIMVFQWHEDTLEVPQGGVLLAHGEACKNQAFRIGNNAYGLQFHIEVTEEMVGSWMKNEEGKVDIKKILNDTRKLKEVFEKQAYQFFLNFEGIISSSLRIKNVMKLFVEEGKKYKKKKIPLWWNIKEHTFMTEKESK
ncbi:MAG: type 1 glutamine amidotransferase [Proteobacteria bacterium]|nr:type 1 glutamine amidotransferase [Pseudomonadota bacterium]